MPLTFPAHQAPVLPLKIWRPSWFDGIALVVGAAAPDLHYAVDRWLPGQGHHLTGLLIFSIPFTVIYSVVLRRWAVDGLFGSLPDLGPLRLRSYRVLGRRRPTFTLTLASATLAAGTHVFIDGFTHQNRFGSNWFDLNSVWFEAPNGPFTGARLLQYLGHSLGSVVAIGLFLLIVGRDHLDRWYGADQVTAARSAPIHGSSRRIAAMTTLAGVGIGLLWSMAADNRGFITVFASGFGLACGLLVAGIIVGAMSRTTRDFTPS